VPAFYRPASVSGPSERSCRLQQISQSQSGHVTCSGPPGPVASLHLKPQQQNGTQISSDRWQALGTEHAYTEYVCTSDMLKTNNEQYQDRNINIPLTTFPANPSETLYNGAKR